MFGRPQPDVTLSVAAEVRPFVMWHLRVQDRREADFHCLQDRLSRRTCGSRRGAFDTPRRDEHGVAAVTKWDLSDIAECVTSITTKNDVDGPNALDRTLSAAIRGPLRRQFRRSAYRIRLWRAKRGQASVASMCPGPQKKTLRWRVSIRRRSA